MSGMAFHKFYFDLTNERPQPVHTTMSAPHVRMLGKDAAVVSYIRLIQHLDRDGQSKTARFEETRVWQCQDGQWQNVHFHRSDNGASLGLPSPRTWTRPPRKPAGAVDRHRMKCHYAFRYGNAMTSLSVFARRGHHDETVKAQRDAG